MAMNTSLFEIVNEEPSEKRQLQQKQTQSASKVNSKKSNYGSIRKELAQTAQRFIVNYKHKLQADETLQAISLKYDVPIENIKRANRLWSNDLAFLKDHLLIPMDRDKLIELNLNLDDNISSNDAIQNISTQNQNTINGSVDINNYLNKFDTFLNESKVKLKSLKTSSNLIKSNTNNSFISNDYEENDIFNVDKNPSIKKNSITEYSCYSKSNSLTKDQSLNSTSSSQYDDSSSSATLSSSSLNSNIHNNNSDQIITSPDKSHKSLFSGNHSLISSTGSNSIGRAIFAQKNLERLEREKDDLYEL